MFKYNITYIALILCLLHSCQQETSSTIPDGPAAFELLTANKTGLHFENVLEQSLDFNVFKYMYYFNGGGVSVGDFNQDGWQDVYLTSNMGDNQLFLNQGNLTFKDVTKQAGVAGNKEAWSSGVSVVDINNDGLLDIYVSQVGDFAVLKGKNQLFICTEIKNGIPIFEDQAAKYGLDLVGFCTQASFFDYDLDGDLDMYQMKHSLHANGTFGQRKKFNDSHPLAGDKLFRNDNGHFTDVTEIAGLYSTVIGYGLGIATSDINADGWPDIYIGNDFHENDYLYINQQDGTFKEVLTEQLNHTSRFSMGVDMADINNDGWSDIISLDMLPYDPFILKSSLGEDGFDIFQFKLGYGYNHQYARNNLQLNNGNGTFSEIGIYADVYATDWSWGALFMDFDSDGYKDLFISNGIPRRMNDIDYTNFRTSDDNIKWKTNTNYIDDEEELKWIDKMPQIKIPNKFLHNNHQLKFKDLGKQILNNIDSYSNGSAYADFDNDGDLDIITNNIEDTPFIYKNLSIENADSTHNYLTIQLTGSPKNKFAIGAKVIAYKGQKRLVNEHFPVRGYQSSGQVGQIHLGLGDTSTIDSIVLVWPDQSYQRLYPTQYNQNIQAKWQEGLPIFNAIKGIIPPNTPYDINNIGVASQLNIKHDENPFVEFNREGLIPQMVSSEGPALAIGDINADGLEDVFLGSSKRKRPQLLLQQTNGTFVNKTPNLLVQDSVFEEVDAQFIDIDNDKDLDLLIADGGNEYSGKSEALKQRLFLNDGKGNFEKVTDAFPEAYMTAACIATGDFNQDGLEDVFFGGRSVPWNYGKTPTSYLYENKGNGQFELVENTDLSEAGLVTDAHWTDIDGDKDLDLLLALEWGNITAFINNNGQLHPKVIAPLKGWWNTTLAQDFDQDGDIDILAGNFGENSKLKPTPQEPIRLYVNDYDDNGTIEQILTYYLAHKELPFANHEEITKQIVSLKKKYLYAKDFAKASITEIFGKDKIESADLLQAETLSHYYFENTGNLTFKAHRLADNLQFSSLHSFLSVDLGAETPTLLAAGNFYDCNIEMGRYDADYGHILQFDPTHLFTSQQSLKMRGQIRSIHPIVIKGKQAFVFVKNDEKIEVLRLE